MARQSLKNAPYSRRCPCVCIQTWMNLTRTDRRRSCCRRCSRVCCKFRRLPFPLSLLLLLAKAFRLCHLQSSVVVNTS